MTHDVEKPNGIAISPDQKTLYVADHNNGTDRIDPTAPPPKKGAMKVYAFPLGSDGLVNGPRKILVDFGEEEGSDGMTVDTEGRIYLAAPLRAGPESWSSTRPDGKLPSSRRPSPRLALANPPGTPRTWTSASAT